MATTPSFPSVPTPLPPEVQEMLLEALELAKRVDQRLREQASPGGQYSAVEIPPVTRSIAN
jgi:hypothetical protein